ncbi:MAG: hypothetical protein EBU49_07185 [Proteobacteria bacterium]|nr:hypothetical protein [Pseudomonadota bacterium]
MFAAISATMLPGTAAAQGLLPEGIVAWQAGYRSYKSQENAFDANFQLRPIGADYTMRFDNEMLVSGKGGKDLQRLATVLQSVGDPSETALDLGVLQQHVSADISASVFGFAYGASKDMTVFIGAPWTTALVKNRIEFSGTNNAKAILDRLGNIAFDELRQGLEQASLLDVATIRNSIESQGYGPIDRWQYSGIGDLQIGVKTAFNIELMDGTLPTGHADDPDLINDIGLGKGYVSIGQSLSQRIQFTPYFSAGFDQIYAYNMDARVKRRVPEDTESIVAADRKTNVLHNPGDDYELGATMEFGSGMFKGNLRFADHRHFADRYTGSITGNYSKISANSDTELITQEVGFSMNTVEAFQRKEFVIPYIARLTASFPVAGLNSPNFEYYEFSLTSFLDVR